MEAWHFIVILGIAVILGSRIFLKETPSNTQKLNREIEETFAHFVDEMEEENKQILNHILQLKNQYATETARLKGRMERLEKQIDSLTVKETGEKDYLRLSNASGAAEENEKHSGNLKLPDAREDTDTTDPKTVSGEENNTEDPENHSIEDRYRELFQYHRQGKSVDWISKQTGMHKGEIQLILKLAKQEEASRA